jgi:hypothetical protein
MAYIGREPQIGNFQVCDAITTSATATYNLLVGSVAVSPETANHCIVSLNGVIQAPTAAFTISGSTIVFASALTSSDVIDFIQILGSVLDLGVPSDDTVSTAKITDVNVTTAKVADNAITLAKMASGTDGNVISYDASGNPVAIATGSDGQVLTSTGAGSPPAFEALPSGGAWTKIATADYSSAVSTFTITDCFTSSYSVYKVFGHNIQGANNERVFIQILDSGGSAIGNIAHTSNLSWVADGGGGGGEAEYFYGGIDYYKFQDYEFHDSATNTMGSMEHTFYQPYEGVHTQILGPSIIHADNGNVYLSWIGGHLFSTTSNRSLKFYTQSGGNFAAYKITVYGMNR